VKSLKIVGCAMAGACLMGGLLAAAPGGGRGAQTVTAQLPRAPALGVTPVLEIQVDKVKGKVSPYLYGLMTENINYCYDGGLYAEMLRNRNFKEMLRGLPEATPDPSLLETRGGRGAGGGVGGGGGGGGRRGGPATETAPAGRRGGAGADVGPGGVLGADRLVPVAAAVPGAAATGVASRAGGGRGPGGGGARRNDGLAFWSLVQTGGGAASMEADQSQPLNKECLNSLKLTVTSAGADQKAGVSNEGYWGMGVRPNTQYQATVWAKGGGGFTGPLTLALCSSDGRTVFAQAKIDKIDGSYKKYEATLTTGAGITPTKEACFQVLAGSKGTLWLSFVSLFPPTYKGHSLRQDIMQLMADMKPQYLRFPGGNYIEGGNYASRFNWKETVGPVEERPGHPNPWGYWSSDGLGLLEFLEWCEDIGMEPGLGVYSGFSLGGRDTFQAGEPLKPYVQDALDEIEYCMGDANTKWGAQRIQDGHPAPFKIHFVEIGNEENRGQSYARRYVQFRDAIKAKYPDIKVISAVAEAPTIGDGIKPDVQDDHHYMSPPGLLGMWNKYDSYDRTTSPPLLLGEWATGMRNGGANPPAPNLEYGLCDGVQLLQFERNSDLIISHCYAPIFINVNPGGSQWLPDLMGFDALNCYGGVSYHVLALFSNNHGTEIVTADAPNMPTWEIPMRGSGIQANDPRMRTVPRFYYDATRDSASGTIYVKVVNPTEAPLPVHMKITGVASVEPTGQLGEVKGTNPVDLNTITDREKIVPTMTKVDGLSTDFTRTFAPYSANVLILKGK
jgi:alpha-L-arabinofuranosidase